MTAYPHCHTVGLLASIRLGDSLLLMSIANNLRRTGKQVTIFGSHIHALARWFPGFEIFPLPPPSEAASLLAGFDVIIQMNPEQPLDGAQRYNANFACFLEWHSERQRPFEPILKEFRSFTEEIFGVADWQNDNGMRAPAPLAHHAQAQRVIIHPTASDPNKYWSQSKFLKLARRLRADGYHPWLILEKREREHWRTISHGIADLVEIDSLDGLAGFIHESGWFIGNDSGIGHLASAAGIPTVTISERLRNMARWRPGWAPGLVVQPLWLPLRSWRRQYWRTAIPVFRVRQTLQRLRRSLAP
jgi:heptosyltransferase-3